MTNGVDPAFERTVQVFTLVGDSGLVTAPALAQIVIGTVPGGQSWLVERLALRYRPGDVPTDDPTYFQLLANSLGPAQLREGTALTAPSGTFVAGTSYDYFADEASPVRFYPGEQIIASAHLYGSGAHKSRLVVVAQIRAVARIGDAASAVDTVAVEPVPPVDQPPQPAGAWG